MTYRMREWTGGALTVDCVRVGAYDESVRINDFQGFRSWGLLLVKVSVELPNHFVRHDPQLL